MASTTLDDPGNIRPWPSPKCHGCGQPILEAAQLRTMPFRDRATGAEHEYRFLFCGSCGTAFAIERVHK